MNNLDNEYWRKRDKNFMLELGVTLGIITTVGALVLPGLIKSGREKRNEEMLIERSRLIERKNPKTYIEDVLGKSEPEEFYYVDGQRIYLKIDGKPVEEYFKK